jgi:hypothetical protein
MINQRSVKIIFISKVYTFFFSVKLSILVLVASLTGIVYSCSRDEGPELSIVTDESPGVSAMHGVSKLTDILKRKNFSFETARTIDEAKGRVIIVAGLSGGKGLASQMLREEGRSVPEVPEALTILKTKWHKKPVWVISGFDDRGLMYALLDVADRISWCKRPESPMSEVREINEQPDVTERAISIYTMNRAYWESRVFDEAYWVRYLISLHKTVLTPWL